MYKAAQVVSFVALVVQNVCLVLQVRTSRLRSSGYDPANVVLVTEFAKLLLNASLELISNRPSRLMAACRNLLHSCLDRRDVFRMTFPALLYVLQNNLLYVALANLSVPLYQVTNQGKIAATAFFGYWFFGRRLSLQRIIALFLLGSGIALAQMAEAKAKDTTISIVTNITTRVSENANTTAAGNTGSRSIVDPRLAPPQNQLVGLVAMAISSITSGIAGVYFEWMLKKDSNPSNPKLPQTKLASSDPSSGISRTAPVTKTEYARNVQLAIPSICLSASALFVRRFVYRRTAGSEGFFFGFDSLVWGIVANQALGGLLVSKVMKHADSNVKVLAVSLSVIFASALSAHLLKEAPDGGMKFWAGAIMVVAACLLYSCSPSRNYKNGTGAPTITRLSYLAIAGAVVLARSSNLLSVELPRHDLSVPIARTIPRILHQFWSDAGGEGRPKRLMEHCRSLHPEWQYKLWSPQNVTNGDIVLSNRDVFDCFSKQQVNGQSDVLRYEVLQQFGGFYVDADTLCLRSLEPLRTADFVASYHHYRNPTLKGTFRYDDKFVASGVLGSRARGDVINALVAKLENNASHCKGAARKTVGPQVVTEVTRRHNVSILPHNAFVPYHFTETIDKGLVKASGSYVVNLWGTTHGWNKMKDFGDFNRSAFCDSFPRLQTPALRSKLVPMLRDFHEFMVQSEVDYAIVYGTALGYARHNKSFIPWDDDTDFFIQKKDSQRAQASIKPPYCTYPFWGGWKMFFCDSPLAGKYPWRYPFMDIFDTLEGGNSPNRHNSATDIMFPSRPIVFEGLELRGPHNIDEHLRRKFGDMHLTTCVSPPWDHHRETEVSFRKLTLPCTAVLEACGY